MLVSLSEKHESHDTTINGHYESIMSPYYVKVFASYET